MTPYIVTPPASLPVTMAAMKEHLRVEHNIEDALIDETQLGAVAMLDAWGGVLGRCIMPQTWAIDVTGPGPHLLPFPDASGVAAEADGGAMAVEVARTGKGQCVTISEAESGQAVTITATYGLSGERLPAAQALVKLIVGNWYENRQAVVVGQTPSELPMAASALISALRWRRI